MHVVNFISVSLKTLSVLVNIWIESKLAMCSADKFELSPP